MFIATTPFNCNLRRRWVSYTCFICNLLYCKLVMPDWYFYDFFYFWRFHGKAMSFEDGGQSFPIRLLIWSTHILNIISVLLELMWSFFFYFIRVSLLELYENHQQIKDYSTIHCLFLLFYYEQFTFFKTSIVKFYNPIFRTASLSFMERSGKS